MHTIKPCKALKIVDPIESFRAAINENPRNISTQANAGLSARATGIITKFWNPSRTLTICFMDNPSQAHKQAIKDLIREWQDHVNLSFSFIDGKKGTIRIKTTTHQNGSQIGTDALAVNMNEPTLFISSRPGDADFRTVVLHEFGHVLGLHHEHLHPDANIPWNKPKVYKEYAEKWNMDKASVDINLFTTLKDLGITDYDKTSIMHYPVEKELTDGTFEVPMNTEISHHDKRLVTHIYPKSPKAAPVSAP